jgi:ferredoxin
VVQFGFLGLTLIGVFYFGANCERWCPFGGVEALYSYIAEGDMLCSLAVSNFFILGGVLLSVLIVRRSFCGYMCPIGTISAWLHEIARSLHLRQFRVRPSLERWLWPLKYLVLIAILIGTWHAGELIFRGFDPCYALIGRHGPDITIWAYVVSGVIVVGSAFVSLPFCRWLCPLAAVLNPLSSFSVTRVRRDAGRCTECGVCSRGCPMDIPVDQSAEVTRPDCLGCMECIDACPANRSNRWTLSWGPPRRLQQRWPQALVIAVLLTCTGLSIGASYFFPFASFVRIRGTKPSDVTSMTIQVGDLTCRGRANLFHYFLTRDDVSAVSGYLKLEAWPGPGLAKVRITYDAAQTNEAAIKRAIVEPYYDSVAGYWRDSPFQIEGYDPLDLLTDDLMLDVDSLLQK